MSTSEIEMGPPYIDSVVAWKKFWKSHNQPWRTEPRISKERQLELAKLRSIKPDREKGIYPFKDIHLNRADVEWLLSTHDNNRGPVDWSDESQREREGLDLHNADLHNEDLSKLPLAKCNLFEANLEETNLFGAQLIKAELILPSFREPT